jgi:hypothetical protein
VRFHGVVEADSAISTSGEKFFSGGFLCGNANTEAAKKSGQGSWTRGHQPRLLCNEQIPKLTDDSAPAGL